MAKIEIQRGATTFKSLPEDLLVVGIDTPHQKGEHHLWDKRSFEPLDEDLIENIARFGVRQAVIIEASDDSKHPFVKDGKRRTLHAREANKRRAERDLPPIYLQCIARDEDPRMAALTMRLANKYRKDDDVLDDVEYAMDLLGQGCSEEDVASTFKVTVQTLKLWREKVAPLPEKLKEAVRGGLGVQTAVAIAKKPETEWDALLSGSVKTSEPSADPDEEQAAPEDLPERKADKKKPSKREKPSKAQVEGVRGKKWFKNFLRFKEYLPGEFVQGLEFAFGLVEDGELPAGIRKWIDGNRWDLGELNDPPSKTIAQLISKTVKAEKAAATEEEE